MHAVQLSRSTFIAHYLYFVFSVEGACYCLALHRSYNWPCCPLWWVAHTLSDPYHISTRFWNTIIMHASLRSEIDCVKGKEFGHMLQKIDSQCAKKHSYIQQNTKEYRPNRVLQSYASSTETPFPGPLKLDCCSIDPQLKCCPNTGRGADFSYIEYIYVY